MDTAIAILLKNVKQKVQQLIADNITLQKQNSLLQEKLNIQITTNETITKQVQQLQSQLKALQLLQLELPENERKELAKSIDKHIATLQKTIILLSE